MKNVKNRINSLEKDERKILTKQLFEDIFYEVSRKVKNFEDLKEWNQVSDELDTNINSFDSIGELANERYSNLNSKFDLMDFSSKYIKIHLENLPKNKLGKIWGDLSGYDYNELKGTDDEPSREYLIANTLPEIKNNLNSIQDINELKDNCISYYKKALQSDETLLENEITEVENLEKEKSKNNKFRNI